MLHHNKVSHKLSEANKQPLRKNIHIYVIIMAIYKHLIISILVKLKLFHVMLQRTDITHVCKKTTTCSFNFIHTTLFLFLHDS